MSALPPEADIRPCGLHVRFLPEADIRGQPGFDRCLQKRPLDMSCYSSGSVSRMLFETVCVIVRSR